MSETELSELLKQGYMVPMALASHAVGIEYRDLKRPDERGPITVGGRVVFRNRMGNACLLRLLDPHGTNVIYVHERKIGKDPFEQIKNLGLGAVISVKGMVFRDVLGGLTIDAQEMKIVEPAPEVTEGQTA